MAAPSSTTTYSQNASASTSATQFLVPLYSRIDAQGEAKVTLVQQETVNMPYDVSFNWAAPSESDCAGLLNGFQLAQDGDNLTAKMRSLPAVAETNFRASLQKCIEVAVDEVAGRELPAHNLKDYLYDRTKSSFASIYGDDVANILETDWSLRVTVDSAGGAHNMWNDLVADSTAKNSAGACLLLAEQIPNSTYMVYTDASENMLTDALPLHNGDTLVFMFNVNLVTVTKDITNVQAGATLVDALNQAKDPRSTPYSVGGVGDSNGTGPQSSVTNTSGTLFSVNPSDAASDFSSAYTSGQIAGTNYKQFIAAFFVQIKGLHNNGGVNGLYKVHAPDSDFYNRVDLEPTSVLGTATGSTGAPTSDVMSWA